MLPPKRSQPCSPAEDVDAETTVADAAMKAIHAVVEAETEAVEAVAAANPFPADI
jgi:hypothetical protein